MCAHLIDYGFLICGGWFHRFHFYRIHRSLLFNPFSLVQLENSKIQSINAMQQSTFDQFHCSWMCMYNWCFWYCFQLNCLLFCLVSCFYFVLCFVRSLLSLNRSRYFATTLTMVMTATITNKFKSSASFFFLHNYCWSEHLPRWLTLFLSLFAVFMHTHLNIIRL